MNDNVHSSVIVRLLSIAFFLAFAIAALVWFLLSMDSLVVSLKEEASLVSFDKGSTYMLGAGIACFIIFIGGVIQGILRNNLTPRAKTIFSRSLIFSVILMFGFPHMVHYAVTSYTQKKNYRVCSNATYRWALYSKFYYAKTDLDCSRLVTKLSNDRR